MFCIEWADAKGRDALDFVAFVSPQKSTATGLAICVIAASHRDLER